MRELCFRYHRSGISSWMRRSSNYTSNQRTECTIKVPSVIRHLRRQMSFCARSLCVTAVALLNLRLLNPSEVQTTDHIQLVLCCLLHHPSAVPVHNSSSRSLSQVLLVVLLFCCPAVSTVVLVWQYCHLSLLVHTRVSKPVPFSSS